MQSRRMFLRRRRVIFPRTTSMSRPGRGGSQQPPYEPDEPDDSFISELVQDRSRAGHSTQDVPPVPSLFVSLPPLRDELQTETSINQDAVVEECLPFLSAVDGGGGPEYNSRGLPKLERQLHVNFLKKSLERYPSPFVGYDASRPWVVYWALTGLGLLGEDATVYRERVTQTFAAAQNASGGFGSGHGQTSHLAPSYAVVLSLAMVDGAEALEIVDRKAMWEWLGEIKQPEGGFSVTIGGEIDVRGAYCAMVIFALLNLPLELPPNSPARQDGLTSFLDNLPEWLSSCQTYEGGMAAYPGNEAHGAYAFCVLACLCILGEPSEVIPKYVDLPSLLSWLSARQYAPEGSFSGRTNKLVDACYSHWVGGCWPLIDAVMAPSNEALSLRSTPSLWCREGLARYILSCSQAETGGLRDKPSKIPDGYHSCYALAGLNVVQHQQQFQTNAQAVEQPLASAFGWKASDEMPKNQSIDGSSIFDVEDILEPIHPVFVIPFDAVERARIWASSKQGF